MIVVYWILMVLVQYSFEFQYCDEYGNILSSSIKDNDIFQCEYTDKKCTKCKTCAKNTYMSNFVHCQESNCTYSTLPDVWDSGCNLVSFYTQLPNYHWQNYTETYWYPARRSTKYGPYEFALWGPSFGTDVRVEINEDVEDFFEKDCLIEDNGEIIPEYCNAKHQHNCTISKSAFCALSDVYCSSNFSCSVSSSYCSNQDSLIFNNSCPKIYNRVTDNCQSKVSMSLSFKKYAHLTILYPECLYRNGDSSYIYCFTDATEQLRKRININVIGNNTSHNNKPSFIVYDVPLEELLGQYWCEARGLGENPYKYFSNKVLASKHPPKGHEYAVRLKIDNICNVVDCTVGEINFLIDDIKRPIENDNFAKVRLMRVNEFHIESFADIIIHVSTLSKKIYEIIFGRLPDYVHVIYVRSSENCLAETYKNLTWPDAKRFQTVLPLEFCLQSNGAPVTRSCEGDFLFGLIWGSVRGNCDKTPDPGEDSLLLQSMLNEIMSEQLMQNVSDIVQNGNLSLVDLYVISQILGKSSGLGVNSTLLDASLNVLDGLIGKNLSLLTSAQEKLNITDTYLRASEDIALSLISSKDDVLTLAKDRIIFHSFNPIIQNASGFVMYKNNSFVNIPLMGNFDSLKDIDHIKLALCLSPEDISSIIQTNLLDVSIVALIYLNDKLFPSNASYAADLVINLNILNYDSYLQNSIPLLVSTGSNDAKFNCGFWDYGDPYVQKKGNWSLFGSNYDGVYKNSTNLQLCSYTHLTHLALLIVENNNSTYLDGTNDSILTVITAIGSFLSVFGIFGIFLTSCFFRTWRDKSGTQILLHLSSATLFEIIFMYMNGIKLFDCALGGFILQYVIISKFCWMLVYAYCQYLRFVAVFKPPPTHFVLKSALFGWGLGLIPAVTVILFSDSETYYQEKFCYPQGNHLYLGLYFPVALVLAVNFFVFCKILCEVSNTKISKVQSVNVKKQHIKLAILLCSVLGIPWIFGLLSNVMPYDWIKVIFVYIFSVTSILQGFLMFVFYVILNKETREAWRKMCGERKSYKIFPSKKTNSISSIT